MTKKLATGYKVITYDRKSLIMNDFISECGYPVNRRVKPQEGQGPLAVFETEEHAEIFVKDYGPFITWGNSSGKVCGCGTYPYRSKIVPCRYKPSNSDKLGTYWDGNMVQKHLSSMPEGSVLADFVTCLE